jgi:hypothetical protein
MDSPELQYLKAMHEKNKRFYAQALLDLADVRAAVATLTEFIKVDVIERNGYDLEAFEATLQRKQLEYQATFRRLAVERAKHDGLEWDSNGQTD